ncbi:MAG: HIT domain-containing protein [Bacteroidetes Order II. Incertae sedis bacterium]|nr:HIT domain-containing protein [Bacteroidetes Order II. bacterium]
MAETVPCPFCSPIVENVVFAEDATCRAIYNLSPILPGHTLVIPKRHVVRIAELSADEWVGFWDFARQMATFIMTCFHADGCDWTIQDGRSAGQTVEHLHLHLIPRYTGDLPKAGDWYPRLVAQQSGDSSQRPRLRPDEMAQIIQHLRTKKDMENCFGQLKCAP